MPGEDHEIKEHRDGQTSVTETKSGALKQERTLSTYSFKVNFKSLQR